MKRNKIQNDEKEKTVIEDREKDLPYYFKRENEQ